MPKTKKVAPQPEKDEDEPLDPIPIKAIRRKTEKKDDVLEKALDKLLLRLASNDPTELQQFTDLPLKLIDPIAKGVAYYEATLKTVSEQCEELLEWYIEKCKSDIELCDKQIEAVNKKPGLIESAEKEINEISDKIIDKLDNNTATPDEMDKLSKELDEAKARLAELKKDDIPPQAAPVLTKKTWVDRIFGKPKPKISPELEIINLQNYKHELETRRDELNEEKALLAEEFETDQMFFMRWAVNLYRNRRSLGGHAFDLFGSLSDAQIVTQAENGNLSKDKIFFH